VNRSLEDKKTMQSIEASEAVDTKDMNLSAEGNTSVGAPLGTDTVRERSETPPTDFSKFPFKFKGRSDTFGKGHQIPDPNQQKVSVSTKLRRQGTANPNIPGGDSKKPQSTNDPKNGGQGN